MKKIKGQISIEYIAGFIFFIFTILFVVYGLMDKLPMYFDEGKNTVMRETAWLAGERALAYAVPGGSVGAGALANMSLCTLYGSSKAYSAAYNNSRGNYTAFKELFGIGESREFQLTLSEFAFLVPNGTSGINYTGLVSVDGSIAAFEIFNYTPGRYDGVHVAASYAGEKGVVSIASNNYAVEKISPDGSYAILSRALVDCGRPPAKGKTTSSVNRYFVYNGSVSKMRIVVWG